MGNPLNPLYEAVAWVLTQIYNFLSPIFGTTSGWTWALSIVILVVLMRLIMVPLFIKQMHTTRAMTALAPQMQALRKKYKNDKQTLQQETMKLYQQAGVNPLMGCLPGRAPAADVLRPVQRAEGDRRVEAGPAAQVRADRCRWCRALSTPRSSARPSRTSSCSPRGLMSRCTPSRHPARGPDQHGHDLPDRAAEHEARHDAGGDARTTRWASRRSTWCTSCRFSPCPACTGRSGWSCTG